MTTKPNKLFPGKRGYTGPNSGVFAVVHHGDLCEPSRNIKERVIYIRKEKPKHEIKMRLDHMLYLPPRVFPELYGGKYKKWVRADKQWVVVVERLVKAEKQWGKASKQWYTAYGQFAAAHKQRMAATKKWYAAKKQRDAAREQWCAKIEKAKVETFLRKHVKNCQWNGTEIVFTCPPNPGAMK